MWKTCNYRTVRFSPEPEWYNVSIHSSNSHSLSHAACFEPGPGLGSWDAEKRKTRPLLLGGHSPVWGDRHAHKWLQYSVYMCCLSSLFLLSPPLQERKTPSLQAPTPAGPSQQSPQQQRGQEELSEPQGPFKLFLKTWSPGRSCGGRSMHFLLGHEINHPSLVSKIMAVR